MAGYRGANDGHVREEEGLELGGNGLENREEHPEARLMGGAVQARLLQPDPRLLVTVAYFAPQVLASIIILSLYYWSDQPDCTENRLKNWSIWAALRMICCISLGLFRNIYRAKMSDDNAFRVRVETLAKILELFGLGWFVNAHIFLVRFEVYEDCHPVVSPTYNLFMAMFVLNYVQVLFPYALALFAYLSPNFWARLQLLLNEN